MADHPQAEKERRVLGKIRDLIHQATSEKSHFYTGSVLRESYDLIKALVEERDALISSTEFPTDEKKWKILLAPSYYVDAVDLYPTTDTARLTIKRIGAA